MRQKVTIITCDNCGARVDEGGGGELNFKFADRRRGVLRADFCDTCAEGLPGERQKPRGRTPRSASSPEQRPNGQQEPFQAQPA